jgi:hypothetical protein
MTDNAPLPGWPVEPEFVRPTWMPAPQQQNAMQPYNGQQPIIVNNYYSAPPAPRRGPAVRPVLGWTAVGGIVTAALLAVATAAIALGLAALAMCVLALVVRQLWRDLQGWK